MWQLFKYRFLCMIRNKSLLFWTLLFPLLLTTLFSAVLRGAWDSPSFETIPIAIIDNEYYEKDMVLQDVLSTVEQNNEKMFKVSILSEKEAKKALADEKIDAYIIDGNHKEVFVRTSSISSTIVTYFFEEFDQKQNLVKDMLMDGYSYDEIMSILNTTQSYVEKNTTENDELTAVSFYTILAMNCFFGGYWTIKAVMDIQANQSRHAARLAIAPVKKSTYLFSDFILTMLMEFVCIIILLVYMLFVLNVNFGQDLLSVFVILWIGCFAGNGLGALIGVCIKGEEKVKSGILTALTMAGSFLAGMMMVQMKFLVQMYAPFLSVINPVNLITDGLYSLYYYGVGERYYQNVMYLLVFMVICYAIALMKIKNKQYESLEV